MTKVHVVVVAWNGAHLLWNCLSALAFQRVSESGNYQIWAVDNASTDDTPRVLDCFVPKMQENGIPFHIIRSTYNRGYGGGANLGMRLILEAKGDDRDLIVVLNQDVEVQEGWLDALIAINERVEALGVLGGLAYYPDGRTIQHAGAYLKLPRLIAGHICYRQEADSSSFKEQDVDFVTGALIGFRAGVLRQVGLFDEVFLPGYYEDAEICVRVKRRGWHVLFSPEVRVKHAETQSFRDLRQRLVLSHRNRVLFALNYYEGARIETFFASEAEYIQKQAHIDECKLLSSAYLLALARWMSLSETVREKYRLDPGRVQAILHLRRLCLHRLSCYEQTNAYCDLYAA